MKTLSLVWVSIPFKRESTCERMDSIIANTRITVQVSIPFKRESTCEL